MTDSDALLTELQALEQRGLSSKARSLFQENETTLLDVYAIQIQEGHDSAGEEDITKEIVYNGHTRTIDSVVQENLYRLTGVTVFKVQELSENGVGIRLEIINETGKGLDAPCHVMLRKDAKGRTFIEFHTLPLAFEATIQQWAEDHLSVASDIPQFAFKMRKLASKLAYRRNVLNQLRTDLVDVMDHVDFDEAASIVSIKAKSGAQFNLVCDDNQVMKANVWSLTGSMDLLASKLRELLTNQDQFAQ